MEYTVGTVVMDGWTIVKVLGEGSFGIVYQIEKKDEYGICEQSALKVISVPRSPADVKAALDEGMNDQEASTYFESALRDIVREIAVMVEMKSCEHIVRYEAHQVVAHANGIGGDILIRMELLTSLVDYRRTHPMDEKTVTRMGAELADALVYCEKKGLIHRDIKPENIFINERGTFKLGDFGIARRMQRTTGASRKGTEDYMAPEVYLRQHYGTTVDIYSLGLVMYKYRNYGRLPFLPLPPQAPNFDDREAAFQKRMGGRALLPPAEAGEELGAIILKACAYAGKDRYRTAGDLKADLVALLQGNGKAAARQGGKVLPETAEAASGEEVSRTIGHWTRREEAQSPVVIRIEEEAQAAKEPQAAKPEDVAQDMQSVGGVKHEDMQHVSGQEDAGSMHKAHSQATSQTISQEGSWVASQAVLQPKEPENRRKAAKLLKVLLAVCICAEAFLRLWLYFAVTAANSIISLAMRAAKLAATLPMRRAADILLVGSLALAAVVIVLHRMAKKETKGGE